MKKTVLLALAAPLLLTASCSTDTPDNSESFSLVTTNIYTPIEGDEPSVAMSGTYSVTNNLTQKTMVITARNISTFNGNSEREFQTPEINYSLTATNFLQYNLQAPTFANNELSISAFKGYVTTGFFWPVNIDPMIIECAKNPQPRLLLNYVINSKYKVVTVPDDMFYCGTTTASAGPVADPYTTTDGSYRIIPNFIDMKANVIFYNVKLAEKMPAITFLLRGLDIEMIHGSFLVKGENIVPMLADGSQVDRYTFSSFRAELTGDYLNGVSMTFKVGSAFSGSFTGEYATVSM